MSDYLNNLITRSFGLDQGTQSTQKEIQPRLPSLFEPIAAANRSLSRSPSNVPGQGATFAFVEDQGSASLSPQSSDNSTNVLADQPDSLTRRRQILPRAPQPSPPHAPSTLEPRFEQPSGQQSLPPTPVAPNQAFDRSAYQPAGQPTAVEPFETDIASARKALDHQYSTTMEGAHAHRQPSLDDTSQDSTAFTREVHNRQVASNKSAAQRAPTKQLPVRPAPTAHEPETEAIDVEAVTVRGATRAAVVSRVEPSHKSAAQRAPVEQLMIEPASPSSAREAKSAGVEAPTVMDASREEVVPRVEPSRFAGIPLPTPNGIIAQPRITSLVEPRAAYVDALPVTARQEEKPAAPTIHVTIGRIEVRATPSANASTSKPRAKQMVMSLDEYLRGRAGGSSQ